MCRRTWLTGLPTPAGRGHRYHALIAPQQARKSALRHLTDKLFKGSSDLLLTHLVTDQLSPQQADRLRALLAEHDRGTKT
jgi:BlaI family penicillinase repressor